MFLSQSYHFININIKALTTVQDNCSNLHYSAPRFPPLEMKWNCKNIILLWSLAQLTLNVMLDLTNFLFLQFKNCLQHRQKSRLLLGPTERQELEDDVFDVLQVLDMFVPLLWPLVGSYFFLQHLRQFLQSGVLSLGLRQQGGHVTDLLLSAGSPAGVGGSQLLSPRV